MNIEYYSERGSSKSPSPSPQENKSITSIAKENLSNEALKVIDSIGKLDHLGGGDRHLELREQGRELNARINEITASVEKLKNVSDSTLEVISRLLIAKGILKSILEKEEATGTIRALVIRKTIRDAIILPSDIKSILRDFLSSESNFEDELQKLSFAVAKELLQAAEYPDLHGKKLRFSKQGDSYVIVGEKSFRSPMSFMIKVDPKKKKAHVDFITITDKTKPKKEQYLGKGAYKIVKKGYQIIIPLKRDEDGKRTMFSTDRAIARPKEIEDFELSLEQSIYTHSDLKSRLASAGVVDAKISAPPEIVHYRSPKTSQMKVEMPQDFYATDLEKISNSGVIPIESGQVRPITFAEKGAFTIELLHTISQIHSIGVIHRDVKPSNVLVNDGSVYLHDFDFTDEKITNFSADYMYWDLAGHKGILTPFSDTLGAVLTNFSLIFYAEFRKLKPEVNQKLFGDEKQRGHIQQTDHSWFKSSQFKDQVFLLGVIPIIKSGLINAGIDPYYIEKLFRISKNSNDIVQHLDSASRNKDKLTKRAREKIKEIKNEMIKRIAIIDLTHEVIKKEDALLDLIQTSYICALTGLEPSDFKNKLKTPQGKSEIQDRVKSGIAKTMIDELKQIKTKINGTFIEHLKSKEVNTEDSDSISKELFNVFETPSYSNIIDDSGVKIINTTLDKYEALSEAFEGIMSKKQPDRLPEAQPKIYHLLTSGDQSLRAEAFDMIYATGIPSAQQVRDQFKEIFTN